MIAHKSLLKQYGTRFWYSDGKIIYLEEPTMLTSPVTPRLTPNGYSLDGMVIHAAADPAAKPNLDEIANFMRIVHEQAKRAIGDAERPGYLQTSFNVPDSKAWIPTRHKIGDVEGCVRASIDYANSGHNVYIEGRTLAQPGAGGERGDTGDSAWVFALVIDSDADKGKGFELGHVTPTLTVESSPGNAHYWFFLEKAIPADDVAKKVGEVMRKAGSDPGATGKVAQPYRVAGTPNYPNKKKREAGRALCTTRVLDYRPDALWTTEKLLAAFAAPQPKQRKPRNEAEPGTLPPYLLREVQTDVPEGERSEKFFSIVAKLKRFLLPFHKEATLDKIVALFEQNPSGIAVKYACRIYEETKRCYDKIDVHLDTLPVIIIADGQIPRILDESTQALKTANVPLYARDKYVVMPHKQTFEAADGRKTRATVLTEVQLPSITVEMAKAATFVEFKKVDGVPTPVYADPPGHIARIILTPNRYVTIPVVSGVVTVPLIRQDGSIFGGGVDEYDPRTGMYYVSTVELPTIPMRPTKDDARRALDRIKSLLSEFCFVDPIDRSVALAGAFTAVVRGSMSTAPMVLVRAHVRGTGKSYLVDLFSTLATGDVAPVIGVPKSEEEFEKRLGALLMAGVPVIALDNIVDDLGGPSLCQVTERPRVRFRILGKSEVPEFDCRTAVFATGNNIGVTKDMDRRALFCNLDAMVEKPENRTFEHNPLEMVEVARGEYIAAILTVIRAYPMSGEKVECKPLGSYGQWSRMVREPLIWLGEVDPVGSMDQGWDEDPEIRDIREFFDSDLMMIRTPYYTKQIVQLAIGHEVEDLMKRVGGKNGEIDPHMLGKWLHHIEGRHVDGKRLFKDRSDQKRPKWILDQVQV
jgi:RepB DNA-primase from phage plasmid